MSEELLGQAANESVQNTVEPAATEEVEAKLDVEKSTDEVGSEIQAEPIKTDDAPKPGKNSIDRRMGRLIKAASEQREQNELLQRQLQELQSRSVVPNNEGAPKLDDFSDIEEYSEAKAKYLRKVEGDNAAREAQALKSKAVQAEIARSWDEKVGRGYEKYEDFDEVVPDFKATDPGLAALQLLDNADDVAYFIFKNKDAPEVVKLAALDPIRQIIELSKLSAKLASEPPKPVSPSSAPEPIVPLSGKAANLSDAPQDSDNMDSWIKKERARVRKKFGA